MCVWCGVSPSSASAGHHKQNKKFFSTPLKSLCGREFTIILLPSSPPGDLWEFAQRRKGGEGLKVEEFRVSHSEFLHAAFFDARRSKEDLFGKRGVNNFSKLWRLRAFLCAHPVHTVIFTLRTMMKCFKKALFSGESASNAGQREVALINILQSASKLLPTRRAYPPFTK